MGDSSWVAQAARANAVSAVSAVSAWAQRGAEGAWVVAAAFMWTKQLSC
jgi:hypothetical protein